MACRCYAFQYSSSGLTSKSTWPDGVELSTSHVGNLISSETQKVNGLPSGINYTYNSDATIKNIGVTGVSSQSSVELAYDKDGLMTGAGDEALSYDLKSGFLKATSLDHVKEEITRNEFGEMSSSQFSIVRKKPKNPPRDIYSLKLRRDKNGSIFEKTEFYKREENKFVYLYDLQNRLVEVKQNGHVMSRYVYDANGNRLEEKIQNVKATYDAQDRLLTYGRWKFSYNASGDLTEKVSRNGEKEFSFDYDVFGNLKSVEIKKERRNLEMRIEYLADALGRRVAKKVNGRVVQMFIYQSQTQVAAELDGAGRILKRFVYGSKVNIPDYMISNGISYRIISDQVGTPKLIVDSKNGKIIAKMEFDEFGNLLNENRASKDLALPFGFAGGLYDRDTKLLRFGARDYDPETGRFVIKDPSGFGALRVLENGNPKIDADHIADDPHYINKFQRRTSETNFYGYALQDPVNYIDPLGLFDVQIGGVPVVINRATVGAFVAATLTCGVITKNPLAAIAGGAAAGALVGISQGAINDINNSLNPPLYTPTK